MKRILPILLIGLLFITSLFSCHEEVDISSKVVLDSLEVKKSVHLFDDTTKPGCEIEYKLFFPVSGLEPAVKDSLLGAIYAHFFGEVYTPTMNLKALSDSFTASYLADYKTLEENYLKDKAEANEEMQFSGSWYAYYLTISSEVLYNKHGIFVYGVWKDQYTGGAHPTPYSSFFNMDLHTGAIIKLESLFLPNSTEQLTTLILQKMMIEYKVDDLKGLEDAGIFDVSAIQPTENFYLNEEGITFFYNSYEIAAYALGKTEITLSFDELQTMIPTEGYLSKILKK